MDFSKPIDHAYITGIKDDSLRDVVSMLWGMGGKGMPGLEQYYKMAVNGFDLVCCHFAVHYFFKNKQTLEALMDNIDSVIKKGGYFIGTCLDGRTVDARFRDKNIEKGQSLQSKKDDRVLWDVRKMYDTMNDQPDMNYGLEIDVYMETINKRTSEYVVDFKLLETELAKRGIIPLTPQECADIDLQKTTGLFKDSFDVLRTVPDNHFTMSAKRMTQDEKDYSFLNRWFVFKKSATPVVTVADNAPAVAAKPKAKRAAAPRKKKDIKQEAV